MLMMRRHEKDFMLRRTARYGDDMKKRVAEFTAGLAGAAAIPPAAKDDITQKLANYQRDFFEWMAAALVLAGEQKAMSDSYATIEPVIAAAQTVVEKVRHDSEAADADSRQNTKLRMQIAIMLISLGVGLLAWMIGRAVSRPLSAMTGAMRKLAEGDFDVVLPGLGRKDEIGDMAGAVETFKLKAVEKAERDAQEREAATQAAASARKAEMCRLADSFEQTVGGVVQTVSAASTQLETAASSLRNTAEIDAAAHRRGRGGVRAGLLQRPDRRGRDRGDERLGIGDRPPGAGVRQDRRRGGQAGAADGSAHQRAVPGRPAHRRRGQADHGDRRADQSARPQCHHRGGARGRSRSRLRGGRLRGQGARRPDRQGDRGDRHADRRDAVRDAGAVGAIKGIAGTIGRVSEIAAAIAAAVEEQGAVNAEISRNVQQAARGTAQVASNIGDVNRGASETGSASTQVLSSAQSLSGESTRLKAEVGKFLATVRAA